MDLMKKREEIYHEMLKISHEIRQLQGKLGGHKAHYNKLKDQLAELDKVLIIQQEIK